jgi:small subunit ribosomal protein S2
VRDTVAEGGTVLFVGTKRQAQETIQAEATRCGMPYVTHRWLGGMLTNWRTIRQRINELERLERMRDRGDFERITKKEALLNTRQIERLEMLLGGIRNMVSVPELLFVVDVRREDTAIHEANLLNIPVVALVDTNCDPSSVDYVIPSNDDAIRAIKLLVGKIADAAQEGMALRKEEVIEPMPEQMRAFADELELSDEELLGEATLAKLAPKPESSVEEELVEEEEAEEGDEEPEEEEIDEVEETEEPEEDDLDEYDEFEYEDEDEEFEDDEYDDDEFEEDED